MVNVIAHGLVDNAFFLVDLAFASMLMLALIQVTDERQQIGDRVSSNSESRG
jgi:hypothetical protein